MKVPATSQKLRGGYYTPPAIARFLSQWAISCPATKVLEPSYGDGNILEAVIETLLARGAPAQTLTNLVTGLEIDPSEAGKAQARLHQQKHVTLDQLYIGDFFTYCREHLLTQLTFDAIIGNPPFIRYQNFQEDQRVNAFALMNHAGMRPTRLTNAWVPFIVASTLLLHPDHGRLAMVVPAELLQVNYAAELRQFLVKHYSKLTLFTFRKLVFADIQQEVVLLLGERSREQRTGIHTVELEDLEELALYQHRSFEDDDLKVMDHTHAKWTQYFLDQDAIDLLRRLGQDPRLTLARNVLDVDVGIVTGLNDFFVLNDEKATAFDLKPYTQPIVTRSAHLQGIIFS